MDVEASIDVDLAQVVSAETPALQVQVMRPGESALLLRDSNYGIGLFGAIELQMINGPAFVDYD